jgi:hypothetical protein
MVMMLRVERWRNWSQYRISVMAHRHMNQLETLRILMAMVEGRALSCSSMPGCRCFGRQNELVLRMKVSRLVH